MKVLLFLAPLLAIGWTAAGWCDYQNSYILGYSAEPNVFNSLEEAQAECMPREEDCGGITQEPTRNNRFTLRRGPELRFEDSPSNEVSWMRCAADQRCNTLVYNGVVMEIIDDKVVVVIWNNGRPNGVGEVDRSLDPPSGYVEFPDAQTSAMWIREDEGKIYWDEDHGASYWPITQSDHCSDIDDEGDEDNHGGEDEDGSSTACDTLMYYSTYILISDDKNVRVIWNNGRPDGFGEIDRSLDPPSGYVDFPDDREYEMWIREDEGFIYWEEDQGDSYWPITYSEDCKTISDASCTNELGEEYKQGESYADDDGKTCVCQASGKFECSCAAVECSGDKQPWTDEDTCESKCISGPGYCSSSGDPHYRTFDGAYYDFHGSCTYQAASCENFVVNFKNIDFYNKAPRYTKRAELVYKGHTYAIASEYVASVDGEAVQVPYVKTYTNGDTVSIKNNGQLEIELNQKKRSPAVRIRGNHAGSYIDAELWLHGSCADVTEGLCGSYNGDSGDDLTGGSANSLGKLFEQYDEDCPAPPDPYHPCDDVPDGHDLAAAICDDLKGEPFSSCHSSVSVGDSDSGIYYNCLTDVCNCFGDQSCACSQYDNYASTCIDAGIDLSDWRKDVEYCPYECPEGLSYYPAAATPAPTCLDRNPVQTGTARGCFCPSGQFLQDGVCVDSSDCRCLYEGQFYENGDEIAEEGSCQTCICGDSGEMSCSDLSCPELNCAGDEIVATDAEKCCPFCTGDWVRAIEPSSVTVGYGQSASFSVEVLVDNVKNKNKVWTKDGEKVTKATKDRLTLQLSKLEEGDSGTYMFTATKGDSTKTVEFTLNVQIPKDPQFEAKALENYVECNPDKPKDTCKLFFTLQSLGDHEASTENAQVCSWIDGEAVDCGIAKMKTSTTFFKVKTEPGNYVFVYTDTGRKYISDAVTVVNV